MTPAPALDLTTSLRGDFFRAPLGILAGNPKDIATNIGCVFGAALVTKTSKRFSRRPTVPISKTRYQPYQTISHAHH